MTTPDRDAAREEAARALARELTTFAVWGAVMVALKYRAELAALGQRALAGLRDRAELRDEELQVADFRMAVSRWEWGGDRDDR